MKQYVWDPERMCYYSRGIGFYAEFIGLTAMGIFSIVFLILLIREAGLGTLLLLIFWIPLYSWFWELFSVDWMWPRENLEAVRKRKRRAWEEYRRELAEKKFVQYLIEKEGRVNGYFN